MLKLFSLLFDSARGQAVLVLAGLAALVAGFAFDQRQQGAQNARNEINRQSSAAIEQVRSARDAAAADPDPAGRLRQRYCRDC
jgi:hypothetical protein